MTAKIPPQGVSIAGDFTLPDELQLEPIGMNTDLLEMGGDHIAVRGRGISREALAQAGHHQRFDRRSRDAPDRRR